MSYLNLSKIEKMIYVIRGHKVMFDADLAALYGVETKRLKEQVKRNLERFPEDFMFELTNQELNYLGYSDKRHGGKRYLPYVFTENGVAMLSSVLNSPSAIQINISIMMSILTNCDHLILSVCYHPLRFSFIS
jgi:hypothetical protein